MKLVSFILGLASLASAHTTFTTLFINGKNQGDGTCIRMPYDSDTATYPVRPITSNDMACGRNGSDPVAYVCSASKGATLTFEFRIWPDAQKPGGIDPGHIGPCAVYLKKTDDMLNEHAAGGGWFKIWEDGFNRDTQKWCVDTLVANNGLLSVHLPQGLPSGYYLVRPEILALHWARKGDPQYYLGCAQIFVESDVRDELEVPEDYQAKIPGYVDLEKDEGVTFDPYQNDIPPYPIPGPKVFIPKAKEAKDEESKTAQQAAGLIPKDCLLKNANWCAKPITPYSSEEPCWAAVKECYAQSKGCWKSAPPIGSKNCDQWSMYCGLMDGMCEARVFEGPPVFNKTEKFAPVPGELPVVWNDVFENKGEESKEEDEKDDENKENEKNGEDVESTSTSTIANYKSEKPLRTARIKTVVITVTEEETTTTEKTTSSVEVEKVTVTVKATVVADSDSSSSSSSTTTSSAAEDPDEKKHVTLATRRKSAATATM